MGDGSMERSKTSAYPRTWSSGLHSDTIVEVHILAHQQTCTGAAALRGLDLSLQHRIGSLLMRESFPDSLLGERSILIRNESDNGHRSWNRRNPIVWIAGTGMGTSSTTCLISVHLQVPCDVSSKKWNQEGEISLRSSEPPAEEH